MWKGQQECRNCVSKQLENAFKFAVVNHLSTVCLEPSLSFQVFGSKDPVGA